MTLAAVIAAVAAVGIAAALLARRGRGGAAPRGDRAALAARLRELARAPGPRAAADVAAVLAAPPPVIEYVCPTCHNRTLYPRPGAAGEAAERAILTEIATIDETQRLAEQAAKLANGGVVLDETQLCKHCSPQTTRPRLALVVALAGESPHQVLGVGREDVVALLEFLRTEGPGAGPAGGRPRTGGDERLERVLGAGAE